MLDAFLPFTMLTIQVNLKAQPAKVKMMMLQKKGRKRLMRF